MGHRIPSGRGRRVPVLPANEKDYRRAVRSLWLGTALLLGGVLLIRFLVTGYP
jgi:hypothetical protein